MNIESFAVEWFDLVHKVSSDGEIVRLECDSLEEAKALRATFNSFKAALKRSGRSDDLFAALAVGCRIEQGRTVVFFPKSDSGIAPKLREALRGD